MKRFFECLIPVTACNLKCDYCYIRQEGRDSHKITPFRYSVEQMSSLFTKEKIGECFFSLCGAGETLFHPELPALVKMLLEEGHYVNITTNGTFTQGLEKLLFQLTPSYCEKLLFSFSLHWNELKQKQLLDVFRDNVYRVRNAKCSFFVQFNLYDGYLPHLEEIKQYCIDNFGAMPQVATTREERETYKIYSSLSVEEYINVGSQFKSPLFEFTMRNFNVPIKDFCYAGMWSYKLYFERGTIKPCYCNGSEMDIIEASHKNFTYTPIGRDCHNAYCVNSSHFLSMGVVPSMYSNITYTGLRNREEAKWFTSKMAAFLSRKLYDDNEQLSITEMAIYNIKWFSRKVIKRLKTCIK